jgi:short-subunit dehydrogenase
LKIFITGGTTGIGFALAKEYLKAGHVVGVCGRDLSKLDKEYAHKIKSYQVDVLNLKDLKKAVDDFSGGKLDIMIANAGVSSGKTPNIPDFNITREVFTINTLGVINAFEAGMNNMLPNKSGHLVAVASIAGMVGLPWSGAYSASKAAVLKLCESYSVGFKKYGVNVTAIAPGFIDTPLTRKNRFKMPFLMPVEKASIKIKRALDKKKSLFIFPWQMNMLMTILEKMPRRLYRFLMGLNLVTYSD